VETRKGTWYAIAAYVLWGLSPIYWNLRPRIDAATLVLSRIVWSVPILIVVVLFIGEFGSIRSWYRSRESRIVTVAASAFLFTNWALFVWSVANNHIVDASLGYFINPLVSVALGVVILGERLRPIQWIAIGIATGGVIFMTIAVGSLPWISLTLAFSFGLYGLLKKHPAAPPPVVSLLGEAVLIAIPALLYMTVFDHPTGPTFGDSLPTSLFLAGAILGVAATAYIGASLYKPQERAIPAALLMFLSIFVMCCAREALRMKYMSQAGYSIYNYPVNADWPSTLLFFATFVMGLFVLYFPAVAAFEAGRVKSGQVATLDPSIGRKAVLTVLHDLIADCVTVFIFIKVF